MNEIRKLMESIKKINEETGGPFKNQNDAQTNARSEIGGGKEGTNFRTYEKDGDWFWTEQVNEAFGDDPDPYAGERSVRQATNRLHELMDEEMIDPRVVADAALRYMSEDDVKDMARNEGLFPDYDFEESVEIVGEAYDEEVSGETRFRDCSDMVQSMLQDMQKLERNTSRVYREAQQSEKREDFSQMLLNELGETLHEITDLVEKYEDAYVSTPGRYDD